MLKPQSPINEPTTHSNHVSLQSYSPALSDSCDTNVRQASIPPQSINQSQTQPQFPHLLINPHVASVLHAQTPPSPQGDNHIQPLLPPSPSREMLMNDINQLQDLSNLLAIYRFGFPHYPFNYPTKRLTIEEILDKFIDEGKREHEEIEIFIKEFRTTNELLLKERSNLLSELTIEVNELLKVVNNVLIPKNEVKGVTTRGGKMTSEVTRSKEINETRINKNEPPRFEQDVLKKPHDDGEKNKSSSIRERTTQPLVKPQ
ncbi:hypothetical protein Tco_0470930 [Tanacetum coccineum]